MIRSMTGFGRGYCIQDGKEFTVEIKTVNSRYCDISIKIPRHINFLEDIIRNAVSKNISRGKVDVYVSFSDNCSDSKNIIIDDSLIVAYLKTVNFIKNTYGILDDMTTSKIMSFQDVLKIEKSEQDESVLSKVLINALEEAFNSLVNMRENEGENIKQNLQIKLSIIEQNLQKIKSKAPLLVNEYREKLNNRLKELLDSDIIDESRLAFEVSVFADKSSIDEEIVRFESHINQFKTTIRTSQPIGRRLDFIIQEMNRETNTIGSKAGSLSIINCVIEIKNELEKLREQVQNIE